MECWPRHWCCSSRRSWGIISVVGDFALVPVLLGAVAREQPIRKQRLERRSVLGKGIAWARRWMWFPIVRNLRAMPPERAWYSGPSEEPSK
jgi:hypothetical protein